MRTELTTPSGSSPITLADAKSHLRIEVTDDDTLISAYVEAALTEAENFTHRRFRQETRTGYLWGFPVGTMSIPVPFSPVVVNSIKYRDDDNAEQTLAVATYSVESVGDGPAFVHLNDGEDWPSTYLRWDAVTIEFLAGYTSIPAPVKQAVLLTLGHLYENREKVVLGVTAIELPATSQALLYPYRDLRL